MDKFDLITRNTQEIITLQELKGVLKKKNPVAYWGIAPTGEVHTGYLIPVQKILDFVKAGFKFKVLIADVHAYLDDMKTPWKLMEARAKYYQECLRLLGLKNVEYVFDSDFKYDSDYIKEIYRLSAMITQKRALRAASEVCRLKNPKVSELIYPVAQTIDCWKLGVDVAYSGLDQRHIYMLARETLPKLGFKVPVIVMTPMLSGLIKGIKSSASVPESNVLIYDEPDIIKKKIRKAWCPLEKENPILEYYKFIIFPRYDKIEVKNKSFESFEDLEKEFLEKNIHPEDLKNDLAERLIEILKPARKINKSLIKKAYPNA
ncbi:MAG: tyrosine--tRNA ligase [Candidatus Aenigmatarchaeota archaeon]